MTQTASLEEQLLRIGDEAGSQIDVTFENQKSYQFAAPGGYYGFAALPQGMKAARSYFDGQSRKALVPASTVRAAAVISNALNNEYLKQLAEAAAQNSKVNRDAKILVGGLLGTVSNGVFIMFPGTIIEVYLDSAGYHFKDYRKDGEAAFGWGASLADILPHAAEITKRHAAWLATPEQMAFTIRNNAYKLEQQLGEAGKI